MQNFVKSKERFLAPFSIFGLGLLSYIQIIPTYFLSDDFGLIGKVINQGMFSSWGSSSGGFFRPVIILSYLLDLRIYGLNAFGFHLTNVLIHCSAGYALYLLARKIFARVHLKDSALFSFFVACLFVVLTSHTESVTWISGRTDVISVAFGLMATSCFISLFTTKSAIKLVASIALFGMALLSKECVVILPFAWFSIFLHDWLYHKERPSNYSIVALIMSFAALLVYLILRWINIGNVFGGYSTVNHISIINYASVYNLYRFVVRTLLPPVPLCLQDLIKFVALFVILFGISMIIWKRKQVSCSHIFFVSLISICYLLSLIPVIAMGVNLFDTRGERFLYLPSAFACLLLVYLTAILGSKKRNQLIFILSLILIQAIALQSVNMRWVFASRVSKDIASEVSKTNPVSTMILNVPDNYRGAYVFRNGLQEAATIFVGNANQGCYRVVSKHSMGSREDIFVKRHVSLRGLAAHTFTSLGYKKGLVVM